MSHQQYHDTVALEEYEAEQDAAMEAALLEYSQSKLCIEDMDAYDLNDPKHPDYAERMADHADYLRKAAREEMK